MNRPKCYARYSILFLSVLALMLLSVTAVFAAEEGCHYCGMKKAMFGHSWMVVEREDGSNVGVCSVHCAAVDMALNIDQPTKKVTVGDYDTKKQIDAEKAVWVIGGNKVGVMTKRAKWAFETKAAAEAFINQNGGELSGFDEVMKATFEDMYEDTLMIQKKRKMKKMK